jgi:hypothetical protein
VIFPYLPLPTKGPIPSLGGATVRHRPIVSIRVFGSLGSRLFEGCLDCASDDTIFPLSLARRVGIDLTGAPRGEAQPVGGMIVPFSYATVTLRLTDGFEICEWQATVGFVDLPLRWALLGNAGFLDFFDTELRGARREVLITPNNLFPGQRTFQGMPSP